MATHKSALKAHRTSLRRRDNNRANRSRVRTEIKKVRTAAEAGDGGTAQKLLPHTLSLIDRASQQGVLHDNAAARYKSRLTRLVNKSGQAASAR
jgi:small subunit ribosomal protein S20